MLPVLLVALCAALTRAMPATAPPESLTAFEAREAPTVQQLLSLKGAWRSCLRAVRA